MLRVKGIAYLFQSNFNLRIYLNFSEFYPQGQGILHLIYYEKGRKRVKVSQF
jgi:hypothetical protein